MKSVMGHSFSTVPQANIQRSTFDRSHGYKTTFSAGDLIPFYVDFAYPGDTFNLQMSCLARIATLLKPPMDNLFLDTHFFSVPYRLLWDNWEKFCGERTNPTDPTDYTIPMQTAPSGGYLTGSIHDYMGLPVGVAGFKHSVLPLRAYRKCWNEWFRDQNLQDTIPVNTGDTTTGEDYTILKRNKRPDYFTSALPFAQKGDPVLLPLGNQATVRTSNAILVTGAQNAAGWAKADGTGQPPENMAASFNSGNLGTGTASSTHTAGSAVYPSNLYADLSAATSATINDIRQAFQYQRMLERDARGGTRYPEIIKSHFQVRDPRYDVLQRPLYLGGGTSPVSIHSVPQTSPTGTYANTPQANLAAYGVVSGTSHGFVHSFTEHCIVLGVLSVRADLNYSQGLERPWSYETRYDHYWPSLAMLGEQGIKNKEIFTQGNATDEQIFGYIPRYDELRVKRSSLTGLMRSQATTGTPLDMWHVAQDFANLPTLNDEFVQEAPAMERIIATVDEPHFIFDSYIKLICARPMPVFGVPGMIDHM